MDPYAEWNDSQIFLSMLRYAHTAGKIVVQVRLALKAPESTVMKSNYRWSGEGWKWKDNLGTDQGSTRVTVNKWGKESYGLSINSLVGNTFTEWWHENVEGSSCLSDQWTCKHYTAMIFNARIHEGAMLEEPSEMTRKCLETIFYCVSY
jgi:hypothetical protein